MPLGTYTALKNLINTTLRNVIKQVLGQDAMETITICEDENISSGVEASLKAYKRWTLYLKAAGAINVTIKLYDGSEYHEIDESPISFSSAGSRVLSMGYDAYKIKLTGSNTTAVTARVVGVF